MSPISEAGRSARADTLEGLRRAILVLRALEARSGQGLADLHRACGIAKPTLLRILATLEAEHFVRRRPADGTWWLAWRPGQSRIGRIKETIAYAGTEVIEKLTRDIGWPADLSVHHEGMMEVVETTRDHTPLEVVPPGWRVAMLASAMGRCWLAFCPDKEREEIVSRLRRSGWAYDRPARSQVQLDGIIRETRERGYGARMKGYVGAAGISRRHVSALSVAVSSRGRIAACLNMVWNNRAVPDDDFVARHLAALQQGAAEIGARLEELEGAEAGQAHTWRSSPDE